MHVLFILVGTIIGWIFIDLGWPSLLGFFALAFSGGFENMSATIAMCMGNSMTWMVFGALIICAIVIRSDLGNVIVGAMMNLKIARKSPFIMSFFFFLSAYVVAAASNCIITIIMFIGLYRSFSEKPILNQGV